ncbi:unnamed protein product, partial [Porites lobata]
PGNSPSLHLLNLQIEKQQLELRLLELEAQSRARQLVSSSPAANKPRNIPSLETVRGGVNSGKSQGQLDHNTLIPSPQQALMTHHLMSLMRLASKYDWEALLSFHAAVLDRIESGLASWGDDFSEIEHFNITESNRLQSKPATSPAFHAAGFRNNNGRARTYCREWNRTGTCSNPSHQEGVEHICEYCKLKDHTIGSCPTRPPPPTTAD